MRRHLHWAVSRSRDHATTVTRLHRFVKRAARVLGRRKRSSAEVEADFDSLLERIRTRLRQPKLPPGEAGPLRKMLGTAGYFGKKIFTCYDHKDIPPTDNGEEQMYGRLRAYERRVTGHKSTSRTVRDGPRTAPVLERARRGELATPEELARVSPERRDENLEAMNRARRHHARPRLIRKRLKEVAAELASRELTGCSSQKRRRADILDRQILRR